MFPPVGRLERKCIKSCAIGDEGLVIPKGVMIGVPAEGIHYDEKYYENPTKFDPERFTPENKAKRNPYTYLPFGTGPRNCIGTDCFQAKRIFYDMRTFQMIDF
jgi:cytochrome P450 family 3 subfamily A